MPDSNPVPIPMATTPLSKNGDSLIDNLDEYRSIVGALQYATLTRPDVAFSVICIGKLLKGCCATLKVLWILD